MNEIKTYHITGIRNKECIHKFYTLFLWHYGNTCSCTSSLTPKMLSHPSESCIPLKEIRIYCHLRFRLTEIEFCLKMIMAR